MTYKTEIRVWSQIGHTPLTKRGGAYCDLLLLTEIECDGYGDARLQAETIMRALPSGARGHAHMPAHPNQNYRSIWI
jgi:hypothetical protein